MNKKTLLFGIAVLLLGVSIILNGYFVGEAIKSVPIGKTAAASPEAQVLNLSQAAEYMNMTEEELRGIVDTEKSILEETSSFSGKMFPYFTVDGKSFFYKREIDEWLKEASDERRDYNTKEGWIM